MFFAFLFQVQMREALRTAKERLRHRLRDPRANAVIRPNIWDDEQPEEVGGIDETEDEERR